MTRCGRVPSAGVRREDGGQDGARILVDARSLALARAGDVDRARGVEEAEPGGDLVDGIGRVEGLDVQRSTESFAARTVSAVPGETTPSRVRTRVASLSRTFQTVRWRGSSDGVSVSAG